MRKALLQITSGLSGTVVNLLELPDAWPAVQDPWLAPAGFKVIDPLPTTAIGDFWDSTAQSWTPATPPVPDPELARIASYKADANWNGLMAQLQTATPAQLSTYVASHVTDLPSARAMLLQVLYVLAAAAKKLN